MKTNLNKDDKITSNNGLPVTGGGGSSINDTSVGTSTTYSSSKTTTLLGNKVDKTTTVNGHALSGNVIVTTTDIGLGNVQNLDTSTTSNITDSTNKRFVTDAQKTVLSNTSGTNTGDQDLSGLALKSTTINGHALSSNITVSKSDVGLSNIVNVDTTNASNITTGTLPSAQVPIATSSSLGGVKQGTGNTIAGDGTITASLTPITVTTATYTVAQANAIYRCDATSNAIAVTLPAASSYTGQKLIIKKVDTTTNAITVTPNGTETIDGATSLTITNQYDTEVLHSNGTTWGVEMSPDTYARGDIQKTGAQQFFFNSQGYVSITSDYATITFWNMRFGKKDGSFYQATTSVNSISASMAYIIADVSSGITLTKGTKSYYWQDIPNLTSTKFILCYKNDNVWHSQFPAVEQALRSLDYAIPVTEKIVKKGGTIGTDCDYTDIQTALTAITDNSNVKPYILRVLDGDYDYSDNGNNIGIGLKNYVTIIGQSKAKTRIIKRDTTFSMSKATVDFGSENTINYTSIQNCTIISNNCKCPLHMDNIHFVGTFEGINLDLINEQASGTGDYQNTFAIGWQANEKFILKNVRSNGKIWGHNYSNMLSNGTLELDNCTCKWISVGDLTSYGKDKVVIKGCKAEYLEYRWFSENPGSRAYQTPSFSFDLEGNNFEYLSIVDDANTNDTLTTYLDGKYPFMCSKLHNYCKNYTASTITKNTLVQLDSSNTDMNGIKPWVSGSTLYGVLLEDTTTTSMGLVQYAGELFLNADATNAPINFGDAIQLNNVGVAVKYSSGTIIGYARASLSSGTGTLKIKLINTNDNDSMITTTFNSKNPIGSSFKKYGAVLTNGSASSFDEIVIESPCVWFDENKQKWGMTYTGYANDGSGNATKGSIGLAWSDDLKSWTKDSNSPILQRSNVVSTPDYGNVTGSFMYYENGTYYLYYIGGDTIGYEVGTQTLCVATSTDLYNWTRYAGNPILKKNNLTSSWYNVSVWHPNVFKYNGLYYMFINCGGTVSGVNKERIGFATSTDLLNWTLSTNSVLDPDSTTTNWDGQYAGDPYVYKIGKTWYMMYYGSDVATTKFQAGLAYTSEANFPYGWTKHTNNPVLKTGTIADSGWNGDYHGFDRTMACKSSIVSKNDVLYHFYTAKGGWNGGTTYSIALALDNSGMNSYRYETVKTNCTSQAISTTANVSNTEGVFDCANKYDLQMRLVCRAQLTSSAGTSVILSESNLTANAATVTINSTSWTNYVSNWYPVKYTNYTYINNALAYATVSSSTCTLTYLYYEFRWVELT